MISKAYIEQAAREVGFDLCGVAHVRELTERKAPFARWLEAGYDSGLGYMSRNFDKRFDPAALVEGARTVVVCAVSYKTSVDELPQGWPQVSSYALARDYHPTIKGMLAALLERVRAVEPAASGRGFCDMAPLLEKAWAVEAGLGWQGKNALVINPRLGSFILLGELVMDIEVESFSEPFTEERCRDCRLCMDACPIGAIVAQQVIDTSRCISRLTVERPLEVTVPAPAGAENGTASACEARREARSPRPAAPALHNHLFGCDICQRVCPWNHHAPDHTNPAFDPVIDPAELTLDFWHSLTRERFDEIFGQTPLARRGYDAIMEKIR